MTDFNEYTDPALYDDFILQTDLLTGQRHKNSFFNTGERVTVTLDGRYTPRAISKLHEMLGHQGFNSKVVGGELLVEMRYVNVTAQPKDDRKAKHEEHGRVYYDEDRKEYYMVKWEDRGNGDRPVRHYFPAEIGGHGKIKDIAELMNNQNDALKS